MKDCLIMASQNAITYKEVFPLLKDNILRLGYHTNTTYIFVCPYGNTLQSNRDYVSQHGFDPDKYIKVPAISWYTTLNTSNKPKLLLTKTYSPQDYPRYDNYDAIEVSKVKDIPYDYDGVMGVPITIYGYDLENVEIKGIANDKRLNEDWVVKGTPTYIDDKHKNFQGMVVNGKPTYTRVLIKKNFEMLGHEHDIDGKGTGIKQFEINGKGVYKRILIRRKK